MEVKLVTGYIPIQGHPRTAKEYGELGELYGKLDCKNFTIHPFYETLGETWLSKALQNQPFSTTHSAGDNPAKNTLAYHCVNHQKFGWLLKAALQDPKCSTLVWMDYGIAHVPGVTVDVVQAFMDAVCTTPEDFAIPGCWVKDGLVVNDYFPCWRFCGSLMIVPKRFTHSLYKAVKYAALQHIQKTRNVEWEVNTLARAEPSLPPIRWYKADHNETMFTNYVKDIRVNEYGDNVDPSSPLGLQRAYARKGATGV